MLISIEAHLPFPCPLVYATYRDKLVQLKPYMPNVRQIEFKSSQKKDGLLRLVHEWHGGGEIPSIARAFLSENLLVWTDDALWNESKLTADWQIKTHAFTEAVHCQGQNRFLPEGNGTRIESQGQLVIDPEKIQGVPSLLKSAIAKMVEELLGQRIGPNFLQMSEGVRQYLQQNQQ